MIVGGYPYASGPPMGKERLVGRGGDDVLDGLDGAVGSEFDDSAEGGEGNDNCIVDPLTISSPASPTARSSPLLERGG